MTTSVLPRPCRPRRQPRLPGSWRSGDDQGVPQVQALTDVSLDVRPGEILALLGENGAGKSTLLKILNGDYQPDAGTMSVDGTPLRFGNPREARAAGFRVIYQEPEIIPGVDVAENIFAGELPRRGPFIDRQKLDRDARAELRRYGFERVLPADRMGDELSSAQRQLVEIMRAVKSPMHVLALDEPTSSLTDEEVDRLFTLVRRLRDEGVAIIYVSHRLREILRLADRVAVLRDGRLVTVRPASELTEREIVRLMVGRELGSVFQRHRTDPGPVILRATGIASDWHRDVSFEIRAGEIVGFAGLVGAGRTELAKVVFGELPRQSGTIEIGGRIAAVRTPDDAIRHGIGFAPEDRKREGLVLIRSVLENTTLAVLRRLTRFRILRQSAERRIAERYVRELNIRTPRWTRGGQAVRRQPAEGRARRWLAARPEYSSSTSPAASTWCQGRDLSTRRPLAGRVWGSCSSPRSCPRSSTCPTVST